MSSAPRLTLSRRNFMATSVAAGAAYFTAPAIVTADKSGTSDVILGQDQHQYRVRHDYAELPEPYSWQTTHNVAVDKDGFLYVIHEGRAELTDHPSIFVFDPDGRFVRAFGSQFQGGGHGLEVRNEDGEDFLYVCAYQQVKSFAKLSLQGEVVWQRWAPMDSGVYAAGEDTEPKKVWGPDRFLPTNFAFLPDGDFFLSDGYGSFYIHRYDKEGQWKSCFGGPGEGQGKFNTPHGIWIDNRGPEPTLVVTDRAHHTVQILNLEGQHLRTVEGFGLPANADSFGDLLLVPELMARVSLLDKDLKPVARLGDDVERIRQDKGFKIRQTQEQWRDGRFVHPHDACFDQDGNIYVAEWVSTGRVSKLERVS